MLRRIHHLLNPTTDVAATVDFYEGVLGMPLVDAERRDDAVVVHFAMRGGGRLGFIEQPHLREIPVNPLPRWIKHLAMRVADIDTLREAERRLRAAGIDVLGPVDHKLVESIYFFDPVNGIRLEFTTPLGALDDEDARLAWDALAQFERGERPRNRAFH